MTNFTHIFVRNKKLKHINKQLKQEQQKLLFEQAELLHSLLDHTNAKKYCTKAKICYEKCINFKINDPKIYHKYGLLLEKHLR